MEFNILPFVMIALCVHRGRRAFSRLAMACCGFGFGSSNEQANRLPTQAWWRQQLTSGNQSFDDYRADTLLRLEEEQRDFRDFLARLRMAKDKAEFDQFMVQRRSEQRS
jgi:hypothetical protein